jgi:guanylate kinase
VRREKGGCDLSPMDMNRGTNKRIDIETRLRKINQEFRQEYEIAKSMSKNFINAALEQKVERLETNHKINNQRRENQLENKRLEKTHQDYK